MNPQKHPKIAVLASGNGSNFEAIVEAANEGHLTAKVVGLICNRPGAPVLERAARLGIPSSLIESKNFSGPGEWNAAMAGQLSSWEAQWVALAGFTGLIGTEILHRFPDRIVNSHPSLLPKYGGKGMYGARVHQAVLAAGESETGISIHLLNERFDEGPVVAQMRVPVQRGDTPETLATRVQAAERKFYPQVLQDLVTGRIKC